MCHGQHDTVDDSNRDEPIFAVIEPVVDHGRREPVEERRHVDEVHSVLDEVLQSLCFMPLEAQMRNVTTNCNYVKVSSIRFAANVR